MNVLIGVSGSIAIYKTLELIRLFIKNGDEVRVVMSEAASRFITPLTFESLTHNKVLTSQSESWADEYNHIDIAKWADIFIIAPATANTVNKLYCGIADNLLLQVYLACNKPVLIAPAANTNMYLHPTTQKALQHLPNVIHAQEGLLACQDEGVGKMADVKDIFYKALRLTSAGLYKGVNVIVTGGGSIEKIDDVRYISNFSTGKMANALALALYIQGANVILVTSKDTSLPKDIEVVKYTSAASLKAILDELVSRCEYLFMAAAVSDYAPQYVRGKIKKTNQPLTLHLTQNPDILASIHGIKKIGFKAERDEENALMYAKKALVQKQCDAICLNLLTKNDFGSDTNEVIFISKDKEVILSQNDKFTIANQIIKESLDV
ncbi:MAG: bifunctional phosphopantothenoylcysteine decarboxylase/phosphopantothenate--cysteine ligase CoaBC [Epsilonproteobacteria bacterium]|nr:bifunctional phosphopantothenoylcysteine decarboxylase/phosphopantothenate--cysteine ligase CoaBC [Campylobacterota bacterium]